jgi:chromosomal replication initiation ATPase DnaA
MTLKHYSKKKAHNQKKDMQLLDKIIADACQHFKVTEADMLGSSNVGDISLSRKVIIYLGYIEAGFDYRELKELFKRSSHSRCVYACQAIEDYLSNEDTPLARKIIKFFRIHGYCADRYKPYLKLERSVA